MNTSKMESVHQKKSSNNSNKKESKAIVKEKPIETKKVESDTDSSDEEDELCFICTEPIVTFAVASCDHRTCHRCTLRLRALYKTRNCAYCKVKFYFSISSLSSRLIHII